MRKYFCELIFLVIILLVMYLIPLIMYFMDYLNGSAMNNMLFVINPLALFICSAYAAKRKRDFYIFPIICSALFIPLVFTLYTTAYLPLFFGYIVVSILGGLFGLWCNEQNDVAKSFKKAFGISAIIGGIFTLACIIVDNFTFKCMQDDCSTIRLFDFDNIQKFLIVILILLFAAYCLKKDKKKKD